MSLRAFSVVSSPIVVLDVADIDTDQIIPARFLKGTDRAGLGAHLFCDWRGPRFPLDQPQAAGAQVLVAGDNFGCGSSREHAPWALLDGGLRAVVSTSFADIFANNALGNGLLPVVVDAASHAELVAAPGATVTIDLAEQTIQLPSGRTVTFPVDPFARRCLLRGERPIDYLVARLDRIAAFEGRS